MLAGTVVMWRVEHLGSGMLQAQYSNYNIFITVGLWTCVKNAVRHVSANNGLLTYKN
jgi:hypothetical protein